MGGGSNMSVYIYQELTKITALLDEILKVLKEKK